MTLTSRLCRSKLWAAALIMVSPSWAALGDSAPAVPSTYVAAHPRLPYPTTADLNLIWSVQPARIFNDANSWNSASPSPFETVLVHLLLAYQASKLNSGSNTATYLAKIQALMTLSAPGCTGNGCAWPGGAATLTTGEMLAWAYDWTYADLTTGQRTAAQATLDAIQTFWETTIVPNNSPYNDQFFEITPAGMSMGGANCCTDHANGLAHLQKAMDVYLNVMLPVIEREQGGSTTVGGGWHEDWNGYQVASTTQITGTTFVALNEWAAMSGRGTAFFTTDHPTLKNWAYQTMYQTRGDLLYDKVGDVLNPILSSECNGANEVQGNALTFLAEVYSDTTLRGWARFVNGACYYPDGTEHSELPWFTPDKAANTVSGTTPSGSRSTLPTMQTFPGLGLVYSVTGFGENDTQVRIKGGDNLWSHQHADAGSISIFNRGSLVLGQSGTYRANSGSEHEGYYYMQSVSTSTLTVTDTADTYATEAVRDVSCITGAFQDNTGAAITAPLPNSGGQRLVGSPWQNICRGVNPTGVLPVHNLLAPNDINQWKQNYDYYHMGNILASVHNTAYDYVCVDITHAYNDDHSKSFPNTSNHTLRAQDVVRCMVTIRRGTAMYVIVRDHLISTNPTFTKKALWHFINAPTVNHQASTAGPTFTVTRTDNVFSTPYGSAWPAPTNFSGNLTNVNSTCGGGTNTCYQYGGKLVGFMVYPSDPSTGLVTVVGGSGHEFDNAGTNYNQCTQPSGAATDCTSGLSGIDWGLGTGTNGLLTPDPTKGLQEPGSYRIEETFSTSEAEDWYLNVMLATANSDANVPTGVTPTTDTTHIGATWSDSNCTYTLSFNKFGIGGTIAISNVSGCTTVTASESMIAHQVGSPLVAGDWVDTETLSTPMTGYIPLWIGFQTGFYSPVAKSTCWWEDFVYNNTGEDNHALDCYNFEQNRWWPEAITTDWHNENLPFGGHTFYTSSYSNSLNSFLMYFPGAGSSGLERSPVSNWTYDMAGHVGSNRNSTTMPDEGGSAIADLTAYDQANDIWVYYQSAGPRMFHWTPSTGDWAVIPTVTGTVPSITYAASTYDPINGVIYIWGGVNGGVLNTTVYAYNAGVTPPTMQVVSTTGTPPTGRCQMGWAMDTHRHHILMAGGNTVTPPCNLSGNNFNDTWDLDFSTCTGGPACPTTPATWTQITTATLYATGGLVDQGSPFEELFYDSDHHVFMLMDKKAGGTYASKVWLFAPEQASNVGVYPVTFSYPAAGNSNNTHIGGSNSGDSNALGGSLLANGSTLWEVHSESTATPNSPGGPTAEQAVVKSWNGSWSGSTTINPSDTYRSGYTDLALVGGQPQVIYDGEGSGGSSQAYTSLYSGSTWAMPSALPRVNTNASVVFAGLPRMVNCGGIPFSAKIEQFRNGGLNPATDSYELHVQEYTGGAWVAVGGTGQLNINTQSVVTLADIGCSAANNVWVAWVEEVPTPGSVNYTMSPIAQLWAKYWNGSTWTNAFSGTTPINVSASNWASDPAIILVGTTPYLAWTERQLAGYTNSNGFQTLPGIGLYVKAWNGSLWATVGTQPVNRSTNLTCSITSDNLCGMAWHPAWTTDGTSPYLAWTESLSPGSHPQTFASKWTGSAWQAYGGSANASSTTGAAHHASLAIYNSAPAVSFSETPDGLLSQQYVRSFGGTGWANIGSAACAISPTSLPGATIGSGYSQTFTASNCMSSTWAGWTTCNGISLNSATGVLSATTVTGSPGTCSGTITYDTASQAESVIVSSPGAAAVTTMSGVRCSGCVIH